MTTENTEATEVLNDLQIVADFLGCSLKEAEGMVPLLKAAMLDTESETPPFDVNDSGDEITEEDYAVKDEPKAKVKCKCCGFYKKPKKVLRETGVCGVCTESLRDGAETGEVAVVGRMGKRGRNNVSVVIDGRRWKVKRLSNRHSENVAKKYQSKGKGYSKKPKASSQPPKGLPTNSRLRDDERG